MRRHKTTLPPRQKRALLADYWRRLTPGLCAKDALLGSFDGKTAALMWDLGRAR